MHAYARIAKPPFFLVALATLFAFAAPTPTHASAQRDVVEQFNATLLSLLEGDNDFEGRYATIEPAVQTAFDLDFMAAKVVGPRWKKWTPEQKQAWLAAFTRLTASNYAGRFVGEEGPTFETLSEEESSHGTMIVRTKLVQPGNKDVELAYRLRETPDGWKVIDCYLDGTVSEIALRRADYGAVLRDDGFEALLAAVNQKSAQLAAGEATPK